MKKIYVVLLGVITLTLCSPLKAQEPNTSARPKWSHSLENDFYFYKNDFLYLPIYSANKDWLHLEARYNYEDLKTISGWFGYNFSGGDNFEYTITPMAGFVAGNTNGLAPGLEFDFSYKGFELYSESEYVFDFKDKERDFLYNLTDLSYSPTDWIWFGLSSQINRPYQEDLEFEPGLLLGGGYRWFELTGYTYNIGGEDPFVMVSFTINLPE